jgi:acyl carrier protein
MESVVFALKKMVIEECNVRDIIPTQISNDETVIGGSGMLKLDSLDAVEIVSSLERHFAIKLESVGDARRIFKSFAIMAEYVQGHATSQQIEVFVSKYCQPGD